MFDQQNSYQFTRLLVQTNYYFKYLIDGYYAL